MKKNRKLIIGMVTGVLLLSACGNTSDDASSTAAEENQSQNQQSATNEDSVNADSTENASDNTGTTTESPDKEESESSEQVEADTESKKETSSENPASLKEEYLEKLNQATKELEEKKNHLEDDSTYALKNMEGERFEVLDGLLNEIYGVLEKQLPADEMEALRKEQREWIEYRDKTAKKASLKYEGGTMEQLEYVAVENDLTEKRCYELVKNYMK